MDPDTPQGRRLGQKIFNIFELSYSDHFKDPEVAEVWRTAGIQRAYAEELYDELMAWRKAETAVKQIEAPKPVQPSLPSKALHGRRSKRAINNLHRL